MFVLRNSQLLTSSSSMSPHSLSAICAKTLAVASALSPL